MMLEGGASAEDRVRYGYKLALAYRPDSERQAILEKGLESYKEHFEQNMGNAKSLLEVGESTYSETLDEIELAAYTMLASVILNLDETITRE